MEPSSRPVGSLLGPDCTLSRGDLHDPDRWVTQSIAIPPSEERLRLPRAHSLSCISCEGTDGLIRSELSHPLRTLTVSQAATDCARREGEKRENTRTHRNRHEQKLPQQPNSSHHTSTFTYTSMSTSKCRSASRATKHQGGLEGAAAIDRKQGGALAGIAGFTRAAARMPRLNRRPADTSKPARKSKPKSKPARAAKPRFRRDFQT